MSVSGSENGMEKLQYAHKCTCMCVCIYRPWDYERDRGLSTSVSSEFSLGEEKISRHSLGIKGKTARRNFRESVILVAFPPVSCSLAKLCLDVAGKSSQGEFACEASPELFQRRKYREPENQGKRAEIRSY